MPSCGTQSFGSCRKNGQIDYPTAPRQRSEVKELLGARCGWPPLVPPAGSASCLLAESSCALPGCNAKAFLNISLRCGACSESQPACSFSSRLAPGSCSCSGSAPVLVLQYCLLQAYTHRLHKSRTKAGAYLAEKLSASAWDFGFWRINTTRLVIAVRCYPFTTL